MKLASSVVLISLALASAAWAQAPAASSAPGTPGTRVGIIDFNRAVVDSADGKKAAEAIKAELSKKEAAFTKAQDELEALQNEVKAKGAALSDTAKVDFSRRIESKQTELTRMSEDGQRAQAELMDKHFGPIAQVVSKVLDGYGKEVGLAVIFDISTQSSNILYHSDVSDITTEIIRRVDSQAAPTAKPAPATPPKQTPTTPAPKP